jgi:hypothetical protein
MEPPAAHVQSIAVSAGGVDLQELPLGNIQVAEPLKMQAETSFAYIPSFTRVGYGCPSP